MQEFFGTQDYVTEAQTLKPIGHRTKTINDGTPMKAAEAPGSHPTH